MWEKVWADTVAMVPSILGAVAVLVVGWLLALVLAALVRKLLSKTRIDDRIAYWLSGEEGGEREHARSERWAGAIVFYVVLLFALVAALQTLGLTIVTTPLNELLTSITGFIPRALAAGLLLLVAWLVATVVRIVLRRALGVLRLDERLGEGEKAAKEQGHSISQPVADIAYWLVFLLFLPAVLGALGLTGLLGPVESMVAKVLGYLPNLFAAAIILVVGWMIARILRRIVAQLLAAVGVDRLAERTGVANALGERPLSGTLAFVAYVLVLIPVLIAALNALAIEAITVPASEMLAALLRAIPALLGAVVILFVAYLVGRLVADLVRRLLESVGFDEALARVGIAKADAEGTRRPSAAVGYIVLVAIMLLATIEALRMLRFDSMAALGVGVIELGGRVLLGLAVIALGLYLGHLASKVIHTSNVLHSAPLAVAARVGIVVLAVAMGLRQMGVANEIINLAFGLTLGAVAVAAAIAFGFGGRDIAGRQLEKWIGTSGTKPPKTGP